MISQQTYINYIFCKKRAFHITSQAKWHDHTSKLLKKNRQLNIFDINRFQIVSFMYKFNSNLLPIHFNMFFQTNEQIHHHDTRGKRNIHLISHNTIMRSFSIRVQGTLVWNSVDPLIKQCKTLNSFKISLNNIYYRQVEILKKKIKIRE